METLRHDILYALRIMRKSPGFALVAILTLALGIGANTAIFSVVSAVLLNPLPFHDANRLVVAYTRDKQFERSSISYPNFLDWARDNHSFSSLAAYRSDTFNLTGMGEPERLRTVMISADFFGILDVKPVLGRTFLAQEDRAGAQPVVMLSGAFWAAKFGSSPGVISKTIDLNDKAYTIIGVVPPNFHFGSEDNFYPDPDIFVPIGQWTDPTFLDRRVAMGMDAIGRLGPGVTLAQAASDMDGVARHLAEEYPDADKDTGIALVSFKDSIVGDIRPFLIVLLGAVGFVLLISCANVASLLLARSTGRAREFAVRTAMGATPMRVVRQLLTESLILALAGGGLGLLLAAWGTKATIGILPDALPRAGEVGVDGHVLLFTLAISLLTGIVFGLVPAWRSARPDVAETLKEEGRMAGAGRHRTQRILIVVEMAMAVIPLVGAGLMVRSLANLWKVNPGFDTKHTLIFGIASAKPLGPNPDAIRAAYRRIQDVIGAVPGVEAASLSVGSVPMQSDSGLPFWVEGQPKPASTSEMATTLFDAVQPGYLKSMGIPLIRGRFVTDQDTEHSPAVVVIDENFARMIFGNQDPIGRRVNLALVGTSPEIVGIVGHVKQWGLDENAKSPELVQCYFPLTQVPDAFMSLIGSMTGGVARIAGSPAAAAAPIRAAIAQYNPEIVTFDLQPMSEIVDQSIAARRFSMILLGIFAGLALALSGVGIYGVIAYISSQRTHEIGIRMALGATSGDVLRMVLGQGALLIAAGVAIGLVASVAGARLMSGMLFGVGAFDALTYAAVAVVLAAIALLACAIPARRAMRVDPMVALRYE